MKHPKRAPSPPGFAARKLAAEAFRRVLSERRTLDDAFDLAAQKMPPLAPEDQGLARAIAVVAFRRLGTIRAAIHARLSNESMPGDGIAEAALVIGAAQVLFLDAADHAAVDLSVELVKQDTGARHLAKLVNAVLRRIAREKAEILAGNCPEIPEFFAERWTRFYGVEALQAISSLHQSPAPIDLTILQGTNPAEISAYAAAIEAICLPSGSVRLTKPTAIPALPGFDDGVFQVQDVAAALPARLMTAEPGKRILDLCAAPGGKTAQLAATGAEVVAVERSAARAKRLNENLARLKLKAEVVIADVIAYTQNGFDAVLLDAPCSATGTLRRHPELLHTKTLSDILQLANQQEKLFAHAATLVRPGGELVYATCSLEPEEGERQIERFLAQYPDFELIAVDPASLRIPAECVEAGMLRILPGHFRELGGADGFFAARLRKHA